MIAITALAAVLGAAAVLLLTSPAPAVAPVRAPDAVQVERARGAYLALGKSRETGRAEPVRYEAEELESIAALVTRGFPPNRVAVDLSGESLVVRISRPVLFRWVNLRAEMAGQSRGFPAVRMTIGHLRLSQAMSRRILELGRRWLNWRGSRLPALDSMVTHSAIGGDALVARVMLPPTGLIASATRGGRPAVSQADVARIYCHLSARQAAAPSSLFAEHVRRAFAAAGMTPQQRGAALVALAMLVVDPDIDVLGGRSLAAAQRCRLDPVATTLHGRTDWPRHWALSAALGVTTGSQFSSAMGEWKELADSLPRQQLLGAGQGSGFSLADLAADRSGNRTASRLLDPASAGTEHRRLLGASDDSLLPRAATRLDEGLSNAEFVRRYGATDDPRFAALLADIDALLE